MNNNNKDKWVYWISKNNIRIVCNRKVLYTLPKDPQKLYKLIIATIDLNNNATTYTQENTDGKV